MSTATHLAAAAWLALPHAIWTVLGTLLVSLLALSLLTSIAFVAAGHRNWKALERRITSGNPSIGDVHRYIADKIDHTGHPYRDQWAYTHSDAIANDPRLLLTWAQAGLPLSLLAVCGSAGYTGTDIYAHLRGDKVIDLDHAHVLAGLRAPA